MHRAVHRALEWTVSVSLESLPGVPVARRVAINRVATEERRRAFYAPQTRPKPFFISGRVSPVGLLWGFQASLSTTRSPFRLATPSHPRLSSSRRNPWPDVLVFIFLVPLTQVRSQQLETGRRASRESDRSPSASPRLHLLKAICGPQTWQSFGFRLGRLRDSAFSQVLVRQGLY